MLSIQFINWNVLHSIIQWHKGMRPTRFPFSIQFSKRMTLHVSNAFIIAKWKSIHLWTDLPSRFPSHSVGWLLDDALPIPERRHERWRKWVQTLKLPSTCVAHTCNPEQNGCVELHSSMMRRMKNDEEKKIGKRKQHTTIATATMATVEEAATVAEKRGKTNMQRGTCPCAKQNMHTLRYTAD